MLTQLLWSYYGAVLAGALPALLLVVVRNIVLAAIAVSAIARLASPDRRLDDHDRTEITTKTAEIAKAAEGHFASAT